MPYFVCLRGCFCFLSFQRSVLLTGLVITKDCAALVRRELVVCFKLCECFFDFSLSGSAWRFVVQRSCLWCCSIDRALQLKQNRYIVIFRSFVPSSAWHLVASLILFVSRRQFSLWMLLHGKTTFSFSLVLPTLAHFSLTFLFCLLFFFLRGALPCKFPLAHGSFLPIL